MIKIGAQQGWQCPQCGYVYSPITPGCNNCNRPDNEKYTTTTNAGGLSVSMTSNCECVLPEIYYTDGECAMCGGYKNG